MYKNVNGVRILMTQEEKKAFLNLSKKSEKTLEELKAEKISELKEKRNEYKKTIFIKDKNLVDLEDKNKYNYENLQMGLCGYTEKDLTEYKTYIENIAKTYDDYKAKINNSTTKKELKNIIITF